MQISTNTLRVHPVTAVARSSDALSQREFSRQNAVDRAVARTAAVGLRMGVELPAPADVIAPRDEFEFSALRFSRSLDERNPHVRSSTAVIVPMGGTMHDVFCDALRGVPAYDWALYATAALTWAVIGWLA